MKRPNILFILTDQQTPLAMSAAGNKFLHTPHMDSLARNGVRFEHSYCAAPVCTASRAALVTGRMPHELSPNMMDEAYDPAGDPGCPTMGDLLRPAGYATAWTGKWHVPDYYPQTDAIPGFEFLPISPDIPHDFGRDTDEAVTDKAIEYLRRPHEQPFLLTVSLHNPHDICFEINKIKDDLPPLESLPPLPPNFAVDPDEPEFIQGCRRRTYHGPELHYTHDWTEHQWRTYLSVYYRLTEQVDKCIGRVLETLREQGLQEDTLVVLTSDHGEGTAAHHWVVKLMFWEEVIKVPLIVSWPGVLPAGRVDSEHLVCNIDLVPTFCDYAGLGPQPVTGVSIRPVLEDPALAGREILICELAADPKNLSHMGRMVRTRDWKYNAFSYGRNPEMLFNLKNDPGETRNLARDPEFRNELLRHRQILKDWIADTNDHMVMPDVS